MLFTNASQKQYHLIQLVCYEYISIKLVILPQKTALLSLKVRHITSQHHDPLSHSHRGKVLLLGHLISFAPHCTTLISAEVGSSKCHC